MLPQKRSQRWRRAAPPLVNLPLVLEKLISKLRSLAGNYGALWQRKTHFWCSKLGFTGAAFCRASRRRRQVSSSSSRCVFDQRGRPRQKVESDIFVCVCLPFFTSSWCTTSSQRQVAQRQQSRTAITRTAAKTPTSGACPRTATSDKDTSYHLVLISTA